MAHLHNVRDSDSHYIINPVTMAISNGCNAKKTIMQGDCNSEMFTIEIPKEIEGHDMRLCNAIRVHYINVSSDKLEKSKGVYEVSEIAEEAGMLIFGWLVSGNATKHAGTLNFRIEFACVDENSVKTYVKWTDVFSEITVHKGFYNGDAVVEEHADILAQWKKELEDLAAGGGTGGSFSGSAKDVAFDNEGTDLEAENVQDAIAELFENLTGYATEDFVREAVKVSLKIILHPVDTTVSQGETANFQVVALGENLSYQWQYRSADSSVWRDSSVTGSNTTTLSIEATASRNGQSYRCVVTDGGGNTVTSNEASIVVIEKQELIEDVLNALPTWEGGAY